MPRWDGKLYWKVYYADGTLEPQTVWADRYEISDSGALIFYRGDVAFVAFAPGVWQEFWGGKEE